MNHRMRRVVAAGGAIVALLAASQGRGAEVLLTTDGQLLEGVGRFEADELVFVQRTGPTVRLELSRIAYWSRATPKLVQGVRLRTGEAVPGVVVRVGEEGVVLRRDGPDGPEVQLRWPPARIAELVLDGEKVSATAWRAAGPDATGALLAGGDLVEGELTHLCEARVTLSSVLFGQRTFSRPGPVAAVRLGPVSPVRPADRGRRTYRVTLTDGTVALVDRLQLGPGGMGLELTDAAGRKRAAAVTELAEIAMPWVLVPVDAGQVRGPGALESGVSPRLRGTAPWLRGAAPWSGLTSDTHAHPLLPGTPGEVRIDPAGLDAVYFRLGLPDGLMPTLRGRFVIELDGKRVARTTWLTSIDEPVRVGVAVAGKSRLTVRLEAEPGASPPPEGVIGDLLGVASRQ